MYQKVAWEGRRQCHLCADVGQLLLRQPGVRLPRLLMRLLPRQPPQPLLWLVRSLELR